MKIKLSQLRQIIREEVRANKLNEEMNEGFWDKAKKAIFGMKGVRDEVKEASKNVVDALEGVEWAIGEKNAKGATQRLKAAKSALNQLAKLTSGQREHSREEGNVYEKLVDRFTSIKNEVKSAGLFDEDSHYGH